MQKLLERQVINLINQSIKPEFYHVSSVVSQKTCTEIHSYKDNLVEQGLNAHEFRSRAKLPCPLTASQAIYVLGSVEKWPICKSASSCSICAINVFA